MGRLGRLGPDRTSRWLHPKGYDIDMSNDASEALASCLLGSTDPLAIRHTWALRMMARFDAPAATIYGVQYDSHAGRLRLTNVEFLGDERFVAVGPSLEGATFEDLAIEADWLSVLDGCTVMQQGDIPTGMYEALWEPFGLCSCLSYVAMKDGQLWGCFNVFRTEEQGRPFAKANIQGEERAWLSATLAMLRHTHTLLVNALPDHRGVYLFSTDGTARVASHPLADLADQLRGALMREVLDFAARGAARDRVFLGGVCIELDLLTGAGDDAIAVTLTPTLPVNVTAFNLLSRAQRIIAGYAVAGVTVEQIAEAISRSPETVRSHLKRTYDQLGIASRAELGRVYERALDWTPRRLES